MTDGKAPPAEGAGQVRAVAFGCLSAFFTMRWVVSSAVAVFVLPLLQSLGQSLDGAIFVAALIGSCIVLYVWQMLHPRGPAT